ncbi:hypothetical protein [Halobacteriovorax sp. DPLXC-1]|uniref:hypothetical protein n=1 Tax=Halobacteriovorax sp. DPLXC-1 TaxID=3110771 RepID=UPI002FF0034C
MKSIGFKLPTFIISLILLLSSCGEYGGGVASLSNRNVGDIVEVQSSLDEIGTSNIRSICSRLRAMRMDLQTITDIESVVFNVKFGSCMSGDSVRDVVAELNANYNGTATLSVKTNQFDVPGTLLESQVQTDLNGVVADFCSAFASNSDVNAVYQNYANQGIVYSFPNTNTFIRSVVIDNSQNKVLVEKQTYIIEENSIADKNVLVERIEYQSQCANKNAKVDIQKLNEYRP